MVKYIEKCELGDIQLKLAIFDFDGTLFKNETLPGLGREWLRQKRSFTRYLLVYLSIIPHVLLYRSGLLPREIFKLRVVERFNHLFYKMGKEEIEDFFRRAYPSLSKQFNKEVIVEIQAAKEQGLHTVLLSGAYASLLRIVADDLGIDTVIGAELFYQEGIFDLNTPMPNIDGEEKLILLKKAFVGKDIDWESSRSYGNSYTDIPVMQAAGSPVAVHPEPRLSRYAEKKKWRVIGG